MKMTRIRHGRMAFSHVCLLLLFSCSLVMASEFESLLDVFGESRRQQLVSSRVRSSTRRRIQNDKNDEKNNDKDATPPPTVPPTTMLPPTVPPTTIPAPSPPPTTMETFYPTIDTTNPTVSPYPTPVPTFTTAENSVGTLIMEMSLSDPTVTAADVNEGRANTLLDGVLAGMLETQCRIHYIMVLEDSIDAPRACPESSRRALQKSDNKDDFPVVWTLARVIVEDYENEQGERLMYWTVAFPVLDIGAAYIDWALEQSEGNAVNEQDLNATALNGMYEDAYYALNRYIEKGYMNNRLPDTAMAVADASEEEPAPAPGSYPSEQLDPHPLHPMRVAGMVLLVVTLVSTIILVKLSARRKKERELDNAIAETNKGGLVTEEGLDHMLSVGRGESEKAGLTSTEIEVILLNNGQEEEAYDDSTRDVTMDSEEMNLMLPGYLDGDSIKRDYPALANGNISASNTKEGAVLQAAKDSASDVSSDVSKKFSFLSMFGNHDEDDSEPEDDVALPAPSDPSNNGAEEEHEDTASQSFGGFVNMFPALYGSPKSHEGGSDAAGGSNAAGSDTGGSKVHVDAEWSRTQSMS